MAALSEIARERGIKYFLISYVDLFGTLRAKLVPAAAIDGMAKSGAGFAGFASWLDMSPPTRRLRHPGPVRASSSCRGRRRSAGSLPTPG